MGIQESIGWAGMTWNIFHGCRNKQCPLYDDGCYAQRMAYRLAGRFGYPADDPFRPVFDESRLEEPYHWRKPRRVFVGSMGELGFVSERDLRRVLRVVADNRRHDFLFLTKMGEVLERYNPWPPNAWVGHSALDQEMAFRALRHLSKVEAATRFLSIEPMRGRISLWTPGERLVDWVIVGGESRPGQPALQPEREWVEELLAWADVVQMPVYMKSNLVWPESERRQKWPERRRDLMVAAPVAVQGALF